MKRIIPFLFCAALVLLTACDPFGAAQIREQAKADQIAAETVQDTLNQEQARQQAADLHEVQMQNERREQTRLDAVEGDVISGLRLLIQAMSLIVAAVVAFFLEGLLLPRR